MNGEDIQGTFYEQELQKTTQDVYRIEKVIKSQGNKDLVKWKGLEGIPALKSFIPGLIKTSLWICKV